jgi:hypothetical protein
MISQIKSDLEVLKQKINFNEQMGQQGQRTSQLDSSLVSLESMLNRLNEEFKYLENDEHKLKNLPS